jgi:hypothetical protein
VILLDVEVWLAAVWQRHTHHSKAAEWFDRQNGPLVFCRVTQMSLLRLLTIPAIMGTEVLNRSLAWNVVDQLRTDTRVQWLDEPIQLEAVWRTLSSRDDNSHKLWTDDYLAAFAQTGNLVFATLDRGFARRYRAINVETLI